MIALHIITDNRNDDPRRYVPAIDFEIFTASEVLAMADKNGIRYPKNRPQPTPESVKALIKEFNNLTKAS